MWHFSSEATAHGVIRLEHVQSGSKGKPEDEVGYKMHLTE